MAKIKSVHASLIKEQIKLSLEAKGYAFFDGNKSFNLNIIGIRNSSGSASSFDDSILVIYRDEDLKWTVLSYQVTTEPGPSILKKPINPNGTAILVPDQYRGVYQIDSHGGKNRHIALCQRGGVVSVYRDTNLDGKPDKNGLIDTGWFGINIHRHPYSNEREYVGGVSAGCQVFRSKKDFSEFLDICNRSADIYGNSFSYTLLDEKELVC